MPFVVQVVVAVCGVVFATATIARAVMYARHPLHVRWEIYPVPEGRRGQLAVMIPEILFLKALHEHNRALWWRSFPFHFGLYLCIAAGVGLLLTGEGLRPLAADVGLAGLGLSIAGAIGLLHRRLTEPSLRACTTAGDIFNLLFFIVAFGTLGLGHVVRMPSVLSAGVVLTSLLVAYIPLTHMSHFVGKFFTYHSVKWDDRPLDARMTRAVAEYLTYRPTWSAAHIKADSRPTWAEVVTTNPVEDRKS